MPFLNFMVEYCVRKITCNIRLTTKHQNLIANLTGQQVCGTSKIVASCSMFAENNPIPRAPPKAVFLDEIDSKSTISTSLVALFFSLVDCCCKTCCCFGCFGCFGCCSCCGLC